MAAEHCSSLPRQHCSLQFPGLPQLAADTPTVQRLCLRSQGGEESSEDSEDSEESREDSEESREESEESREESEENSGDSEDSEESSENEVINEENEEQAGWTYDMKNVSSHRSKENFDQFRPLLLQQPRRLETSEFSVNIINEEDHLDHYDLDAAGSYSDDESLLQFSDEAFTATTNSDEGLYDFQPWTETTLLSNEILETSTITAPNENTVFFQDKKVGPEEREDDTTLPSTISIFSDEEATTIPSLSSSLLDVRREDKKLFSSMTETQDTSSSSSSSSSSSFSVSSEERRLVSLRPESSGSK